MEAKKCDRCDKYYDKNEKHQTTGRIYGDILTGLATVSTHGECDGWFDLCDDCLNDFGLFMQGHRVR